jgi:hypothetical protein
MTKQSLEVDVAEAMPPSLAERIAPFAVQDPREIAERLVVQALGAETLDAIFASAEMASADDVAGIPLRIRGVQWNPSSFGDGPSFYAVLDCVDDAKQEEITVGCGSVLVLAQLIRVQELRLFPITVTFKRRARATAAGFYPIIAELVPGF